MRPLGAKKNWGQEWAVEKWDALCLKAQGRARSKREAEKEIEYFLNNEITLSEEDEKLFNRTQEYLTSILINFEEGDTMKEDWLLTAYSEYVMRSKESSTYVDGYGLEPMPFEKYKKFLKQVKPHLFTPTRLKGKIISFQRGKPNEFSED